MERLEKRRAKEVLVKEEKKVLAPVIYLYRIIYLNNMEHIRLAVINLPRLGRERKYVIIFKFN